jgi:hypothetical protein
MKIILSVVFAFLLSVNTLSAQVDKIEPPFWWTNMPIQELQIQFYGENLGDYRAFIDYCGIQITQQIAVDSKNYLFLYVEVSP